MALQSGRVLLSLGIKQYRENRTGRVGGFSGAGGAMQYIPPPLGVSLGFREEEAGRKSLKPAPTPCLTSILHSHTHRGAAGGWSGSSAWPLLNPDEG